MKKLIALIMAVILCASVFAACGEKQKTVPKGLPSDSVNKDDDTETIKQFVVCDRMGIKITTKNIGYSEAGGKLTHKALYLEVKNGYSKDIEVGITKSSVNNYMIPSDSTVKVESGKTKEFAVSFDVTKLNNSEITTFAVLEFVVSVKDNETGDVIFETKPVKLRTSAADGFEYENDQTGTVAYNGNRIRIVVQEIYYDEFSGQCVNVLVMNYGRKNISLSLKDCKLNGKKVEPIYCSDVLAGKKDVSPIAFDEDVEGERIEEFSTSFSIVDSDTGKTIVKKTKPVTVKFDNEE
ncbi:MAG: hypothetical protein IJ932_04365 [Ruminococcus sp.]|nr:hypothetical protein [Ruminococcus sp.]